jgi:hypothetical protein
MECIMEVKTYSKLFPAKMAAAKLTKKHGVKYIPVGPDAVDGTYIVELEVPSPAKAKRLRTTKRGLKLGEHIPNGGASFKEQVAALWKFAELTGDSKLENYIDGMPEYCMLMIIGGSKTRWGAIGNVRAAMVAA